jgi:hypothetical protein
MVADGTAVRSLVTPSIMSPTVRSVLSASSGISMLNASSTSKEMLILSRESMLSSSKVLASVIVLAGMPFDLAMMSIQRSAMSFMVIQLPRVSSTYSDASTAVKIADGLAMLSSKHLETCGEQTVGTEDTKRGLTNMHLKELLEDERAALEGAEELVAQAGRAIQYKERAGHEARETLDAPVSLLIGGKVVILECGCESRGLAEAESKAFTGDSVDGTRGVTYKGDVFGSDSVEFAVDGDGSSRSTTERSVGKVILQGWELAESFH